MKKLVFVNQKGGTGKSTLSYNFAHFLADKGFRVLFIDGDEQANASKSLAVFSSMTGTSTLFGSEKIEPLTMPQQIVLMKGDDGLRKVEKSSCSDEELVQALTERLEDVSSGFDYAVIDTAGANSRVANALTVASDYTVLPCRIDPYSIEVATQVIKRIAFIQRSWNPELTNIGILPNEFDATSPAQVSWLKQLMGAYKDYVVGAFVAKRSAYREAAGKGVPVWRLGTDEDEGKGRVKTSARNAGRELKAVFEIVLRRMEH